MSHPSPAIQEPPHNSLRQTWAARRAARSLGWLLMISGFVSADTPLDFEKHIAPLLVTRCIECHQGSEPAGGLLLTTHDGLLAGGESGPVINRDDPRSSYLLQRLTDGEMPPPKQGKPQRLAEREIEQLRRWFVQGAGWPRDRELDWLERTTAARAGRDWWSLQPIERPAVPTVSGRQRADHPIDAFILAKLARHQMVPAPRADKRTLLRRVYYDLIGLPPTQQQVEAYLSDDSPQAWERVVDRLLQTPQYGERWGRYWLDLARYADTSGYERDQEKPFAWKYRDWVVRALNDDLPYAEFVTAQIAGDEIETSNEQAVVATGFLRLGTWNDEPNQPEDYQYDRLEDMVHTTATTFLGLTVKCARCHTHKFDPIRQEDYYRIASAFWAGPIAARDRELLGGPSEEELGFVDVLAWTDLSPQPPPLHVLKNGERTSPLQVAVPASLSTIPAIERTFDPPRTGARTSQRRLQLARWITDPQNPLSARVIVNRIWQHHFGQALVRTPNNFGFLADPPTHPELLDWLAAEFLETGGSLKQMHRLMLSSRTWQQSSTHPQQAAFARRDSANRLWWRAQRRRLDAEALRDSLLWVAGQLDLTLGGESFRPTISPEALEGLSRKSAAWQASPAVEQNRRSIYMFLKRGLLPPTMTSFNLPDATQPCGMRDVTTVPTQALALLNNRFVHDRSQHLALQIRKQATTGRAQIQRAWSQVLGRAPSSREAELSLQHVARQQKIFSTDTAAPSDIRPEVLALASLCHALMNSNEFLYVD